MKPEKIYFNPNEIAAIALGLGRVIEDFEKLKEGENANIPWNPLGRQPQKEILTNVRSAAAKIEKFTGVKCTLPPYIPGDEDEFLTKES